MMRFRPRGPGLLVAALLALAPGLAAQSTNDDLGAWFMADHSARLGTGPWGWKADAQFRIWDLAGDFEQGSVRAMLTWSASSRPIELGAGLMHLTDGELGASDARRSERRAFQQAELDQAPGEGIELSHRVRIEQRWIEGQRFRTRYRYKLTADVDLDRMLGRRAEPYFVSLAIEAFLNGERDIGGGREVDLYDRTRFYGALGVELSSTVSAEVGYMVQRRPDVSKGQLQFGISIDRG